MSLVAQRSYWEQFLLCWWLELGYTHFQKFSSLPLMNCSAWLQGNDAVSRSRPNPSQVKLHWCQWFYSRWCVCSSACRKHVERGALHEDLHGFPLPFLIVILQHIEWNVKLQHLRSQQQFLSLDQLKSPVYEQLLSFFWLCPLQLHLQVYKTGVVPFPNHMLFFECAKGTKIFRFFSITVCFVHRFSSAKPMSRAWQAKGRVNLAFISLLNGALCKTT